MSRPRVSSLAGLYTRVANTTLGGGATTVAALQRELVERRRWITLEQFGLAFGLARLTPGTNVLAFCAATGWMIRGLRGAWIAVLAASIPCAVFAVWLTSTYSSYEHLAWVRRVAGAVSAAVIGMIAASVLGLLRPQYLPGCRARTLIIPAVAFCLATLLGWPPIPVLALGALTGRLWPEGRRP